MSVGVVFVSTGGNKMMRALRSLRRTEPRLPVHIAFSTSSKVWPRNNAQLPYTSFESEPNVLTRLISSPGWINGCFNESIKWMRELGYTHACTIHDDVVFSPLAEHYHHLSKWFSRLESDPELSTASGLTLSFMEALVKTDNPGVWERSPDEWDRRDLESDLLWETLCPNGRPAMYFGSPGSSEGVSVPLILTEQNIAANLALTDWFAKYFVTERICPMARLGPCGQIVPISVWEAIGGFDEANGIFYDMEYPIQCALRGLPPVKVIPNIPYIHLHNQSTAFGDPAVGIWGHDLQSFIAKYGKDPGAVLLDLPNRGGY